MTDYTLGYRMGLALGCATQGVTPATLRKQASKAEACLQNISFQQAIAGIAETIFVKAGSDFEKSAAIYATIRKQQTPLTKFATATFITPVIQTLSAAAQHDALVKEASLLKSLGSAVSGLWGGTQDVLYKLALLGLIGGGTAGVVANIAGRHMREEDAEAEAKKEQAKHYRRIAKDLQKRIDATTNKSEFKKKIENEDESDYVL